VATGGGAYLASAINGAGNNHEVQRSAPVTGNTNTPSTSGQIPDGWMAHSADAFTVYVVCLNNP
jgi:hypothetical protein